MKTQQKLPKKILLDDYMYINYLSTLEELIKANGPEVLTWVKRSFQFHLVPITLGLLYLTSYEWKSRMGHVYMIIIFRRLIKFLSFKFQVFFKVYLINICAVLRKKMSWIFTFILLYYRKLTLIYFHINDRETTLSISGPL